MDEVTITLPAYAVRYLVEMCEREREALNDLTSEGPVWTIGAEASFDSLNTIECAIPAGFFQSNEVKP